MRNKAILKTLRPEPIVNIINGKQTVVVCKKFPKDYVGWVYLCCSKCSKKNYHLIEVIDTDIPDAKSEYEIDYYIGGYKGWQDDCLDGKVCARFWCDKVEDIKLEPVEDYSSNTYEYMTETLLENDLLKKSCLHTLELSKYLQGKKGYAIHISKLEVFEEPKRVDTFFRFNRTFENRPKHCDPAKTKLHCCYGCKYNFLERKHGFGSVGCDYMRLREAPKNHCYIES